MVGENIDINIRAFDKASATLNKVQAQVNSMSSAASKQFANMRHKMGRFVPSKMLNAQAGQVSSAINQMTARLDGFNSLQRVTKKRTNSMMEAFDGAAMGMMFFGMQMKRIFGGIIRSGIKTFNKVMGKLEDTTTNADRLSGAFQFLKFQVGKAFEPLLGFLVPIIANIADFVKQNQTLTASFLSLGAALGTAAMTLGAVQLGYLSVKSAFTSGGFIYDTISSFGKLGSKLKTVSSKLGGIKGTVSKLGRTVAIGFAIDEAVDVAKQISEGEYGKAIKNALATALFAMAAFSPAAPAAALFAIGITLKLLELETILDAVDTAASYTGAYFESVWETVSNNIGQFLFTTITESIIQAITKLPPTVQEQLGLDNITESMFGNFDQTFGGKFNENFEDNLKEWKQVPGIKEKLGYGDVEDLPPSLRMSQLPTSELTSKVPSADDYIKATNDEEKTPQELAEIADNTRVFAEEFKRFMAERNRGSSGQNNMSTLYNTHSSIQNTK